MTSTVPTLSDLLNERPDTRYPLTDAKITTRCPDTDCFTLQSLAEARCSAVGEQGSYRCRSCDSTLVEVRRGGDGSWEYDVVGGGLHFRLANARRVQTR